LVEVKSGRVLASQRITGEPDEQIFSMVDKLTVEVKKDLSLPAEAQQEKDPKVADVTTHSPEAYRYYLEGLDYDFKLYWREAEESYKRALELDSTFAMAYCRLAMNEAFKRRRQAAKELMAKAVEYSDKVSQKEKYYIKSLEAIISGNYAQAIKELQKIVERYPDEKEAFLLMGYAYGHPREFEEAIRQYTKAVKIDPLYKLAYNQLAYAYNDIGDYEKSIWAINQYISIVPDEANPYDSRADLYAFNGKIDQAIESYKKALEMKPEFYMSLTKLGHMYLFKTQYVKAESCYQQLSSSSEKDTRSEGRTCLALIPFYQGKLEEALKVLDDGIAADRMEQAEGKQKADKHFLKASIYQEKKNLDLALTEAETCTGILEKADPDDPLNSRNFYAQMLAENAEIAKAEEVARALKKDVEKTDPHVIYVYWLAMATIEQAKGNTITAVTYLEKAAGVALPPHDLRVLTSYMELFQVQFLLAAAYLESGRQGEAVAVLEKALSSYDETRASAPLSAVKCYYLLGLAYEKSGWNKKAIERYEEFLDIWKDADPGIPEVEDAKQRLEKLRVQS
jgi:tetratricopeptide (TPR) repeat protein